MENNHVVYTSVEMALEGLVDGSLFKRDAAIAFLNNFLLNLQPKAGPISQEVAKADAAVSYYNQGWNDAINYFHDLTASFIQQKMHKLEKK